MTKPDHMTEREYRTFLTIKADANPLTVFQIQQLISNSELRELVAIEDLEQQWAMPAVEGK